VPIVGLVEGFVDLNAVVEGPNDQLKMLSIALDPGIGRLPHAVDLLLVVLSHFGPVFRGIDPPAQGPALLDGWETKQVARVSMRSLGTDQSINLRPVSSPSVS